MSALLLNAFRVLGSGPSRREVALVAKALRESGDVEVGPLLDYANNRDLWERCIALADEAGAYGFVALDLALAFHNPEAFAKLVRGEDDHLPPRPVGFRCTHTATYAPAVGARRMTGRQEGHGGHPGPGGV